MKVGIYVIFHHLRKRTYVVTYQHNKYDPSYSVHTYLLFSSRSFEIVVHLFCPRLKQLKT